MFLPLLRWVVGLALSCVSRLEFVAIPLEVGAATFVTLNRFLSCLSIIVCAPPLLSLLICLRVATTTPTLRRGVRIAAICAPLAAASGEITAWVLVPRCVVRDG